jgi:hypothetical protein
MHEPRHADKVRTTGLVDLQGLLHEQYKYMHVPVYLAIIQVQTFRNHHNRDSKMIGLQALIGILAYFLSIRLTTADSLRMRKCYCLSPTEVGFVTTHNWTRASGAEYLWERHETRVRNDDKCRISGTQCTRGNDSDCWTISEVQCYKGLTEAASPRNEFKACVNVSDVRICNNESRFVTFIGDTRGKVIFQPRRYPPKKVLDCSEECRATWPEKTDMRSACSHRNTNPKSKHFGEDVPSGWHWAGRRLGEDGRFTWGMRATCQDYHYPSFGSG